MPFKYAIALTGGIATGKSSASKIFKSLGCEILDADKISHEILDSEYENIAKIFGASLVVNQKVDRKALGAVVFDDKVKRQQLEALLHPLIYESIEKKSQLLDEKKCCYFVDIPLFFENRRYPIKRVLVIAVSPPLQLQRLMQRDGTTQKEAQKRIDAQLSIEEKIKNADYVIENTATLTDLEEKCIMMKEKILADFGTYH
jgi:dephospho-CoA kinase